MLKIKILLFNNLLDFITIGLLIVYELGSITPINNAYHDRAEYLV